MSGHSLPAGHPLSEELTSLRAAVLRFQTEAHASALNLQHHVLSTSALNERVAQLEADNALLSTEVEVLRANPSPSTAETSPNGQETVAELTLSLRRLSAKLTLTESSLAEATQTLVAQTNSAREAGHAASEAYALAARARAREEEWRVVANTRERELDSAKEEARLSDLVVREYAGLVRTLEGRKSTTSLTTSPVIKTFQDSTTTLVEPKETIESQKTQLAELKSALTTQAAEYFAQINALEKERDETNARFGAANALTVELGEELAKAKFEAEQAKVDDKSAAGMVERYMKFTQQTTQSLHSSLNALRERHTATTSTLTAQLSALASQLSIAKADIERLRAALDESGGALVRETVGRRREVALRMKLVAREERVVDSLKEALSSSHNNADAMEPALAQILVMLDGQGNEGKEGRMQLLENAVQMLVGELEEETKNKAVLDRDGKSQKQNETMDFEDVSEARQAMKESEKGTEMPLTEPDDNDLEVVVSREELDNTEDSLSPMGPLENIDAKLSSLPPTPPRFTDSSSIFPTESTMPEALSVGPIATTIPPNTTNASELTPHPTPDSPSNANISIAFASASSSSSLPRRHSSSSPPLETLYSPTQVSQPKIENPLLVPLFIAGERYAELQNAFKKCHLVLQELKGRLQAQAPQTQTQKDLVLNAALERLHDYTEDARVELEICVADGEVVRRGWEAIAVGDIQHRQEDVSNEKGHNEINAFVERETRVQAGFRRKVVDVEHDVEILKRLMDGELDQVDLEGEMHSPVSPTPSISPSSSTPTFSNIKRPSSPYTYSYNYTPPGPGEAQTFGSLMTSPNSLRREASVGSLRREANGSPSSTRVSLSALSTPARTRPKTEARSPFEGLGLRVPMPAFVGGNHVASPSGLGLAKEPVRQRTVSGVFMLGLGSAGERAARGRRPSGFGLGLGPPGGQNGTSINSATLSLGGDVE
ncbi:hypothetical protein MIND_00295200 [Mycena indigotica]|uniref:Uncharacterized protein n=1 Tax=Mycena indigotica TaxID=2126181 RepID=A0A8H6WEA0_9AGAR|nr:uncharacterized protein MIND_00295200 [Mycena indigotica]KAF7309249.1 hypothetical protein MIND_00295200 [Mycena indigotica]